MAHNLGSWPITCRYSTRYLTGLRLTNYNAIRSTSVSSLSTDNLTSTTEVDQTVTPYYALSTGIAPAPVMLRLGNSTIDSTKAFKVPQPTSNPDIGTSTVQPNQVNQINTNIDMVPHVVSVKNTYFDHDRRYGPTFEDTPDGNITKITVQLGEDAHLNCRISLLQDKTVSWIFSTLFYGHLLKKSIV